MLKKIISIMMQLLLAGAASASVPEFVRKAALSELDYATVYSIVQSDDSAIWISSSQGLLRYNGCSLRKIHDLLPMVPMSFDGNRTLWAVGGNYLVAIDTRNFKKKYYTASGLDFTRSKICSSSGAVWMVSGKKVYTCAGDSLALYSETGLEEDISYALVDADGVLMLSSGPGLWKFHSGKLFPVKVFPRKITCFFFDSSGCLWTGWRDGGFSKYAADFSLIADYPASAGIVRVFCEDRRGNVYAGSTATLSCVDPEHGLLPPFNAFSYSQPVTTLLADVSGNVWAGTFYSGLWFSAGSNCPFDNLEVPSDFRNVRAAASLSGGSKVILTDGNGAYLYGEEGLSLIPGSTGFKFISSCDSPSGDFIYAGLHDGRIMKVSSACVTPVRISCQEGAVSSVNGLLYLDGSLYCATDSGLLRMKDNGSFLEAGRVEGPAGQILSISADSEGRVFASGRRGLWLCSRDGISHKIENGYYPFVCCSDGDVWFSRFGRGFGRVTNSNILSYDSSSCGIPDNFISFIEPLKGGRLLLGTRSGLSIFDSASGSCYNFGRNSGLKLSSARSGATVRADSSSVLVFGVDGAALLREGNISFSESDAELLPDLVILNGNELLRPSEGPLVFSGDCNNLQLEFANFDYSGISSSHFLYSFSPSSGSWTAFDISSPLSLVNLHSGRYELDVKSADGREKVSLGFRIRPPWYFSAPAVIIFSIFLLSLVIVILTMYYRRLLLAQKLKDKEAENAERTRLFIKLSHDVRTPLSALIGHMELFFGRYGKNSPGSNILKQSYKGALEMNRIISSFLEIEDSAPSYDITDLPEFKHEDMYRIVPKEYTMLIADDDPDMRSLLKEVFKDEYELLFASDGREACRIAHDLQPDIIVSDVMMPEMDGMTLCATLRKDYETRHIPIVLITAHASERHNLEGIALGADDYVTKPFSVELLRARCRTLIVNRKAIMDKIAVRNPSAAGGTAEKRRDNFLNAAIGAVERNISSKELNVGMLCSLMNMSKTTLTSKLEAACGMSPRDFIEDIKLKYATRLLSEGGSRISEIADSLNFSSQKYFTLRFKKKFGVPPSEYGK